MELELPPDFKEFLNLLRIHGVEYLPERLKENKKASGRLEDLADLEQLP